MPQDDLRADCRRCAALCCVATTFERSPDFGCSKAGGVPCAHLRDDRCAIHADRVARGFSGCVAYDCYGAGQRITEELLGGGSWLTHPTPDRLFAAFLRAAAIHELRAILDQAATLELPPAVRSAVEARRAHLRTLPGGSTGDWRSVDVDRERREVDRILTDLRALVRRR